MVSRIIAWLPAASSHESPLTCSVSHLGQLNIVGKLGNCSSQLTRLRHRRSGKSHEFPYTWEQPHSTRCVCRKNGSTGDLAVFFCTSGWFCFLYSQLVSLQKEKKWTEETYNFFWDSMRGPFCGMVISSHQQQKPNICSKVLWRLHSDPVGLKTRISHASWHLLRDTNPKLCARPAHWHLPQLFLVVIGVGVPMQLGLTAYNFTTNGAWVGWWARPADVLGTFAT